MQARAERRDLGSRHIAGERLLKRVKHTHKTNLFLHMQTRAERVELGSRHVGQEALLKHELHKRDKILVTWNPYSGTMVWTSLICRQGQKDGVRQQADCSGEAAEG